MAGSKHSLYKLAAPMQSLRQGELRINDEDEPSACERSSPFTRTSRPPTIHPNHSLALSNVNSRDLSKMQLHDQPTVTSTEMRLPVKMATHKWDIEDMEGENDRRFSTNFVGPSAKVSLPVRVVKHTPEMEDEELSKHERRFSSNFVPLLAATKEEENIQDEDDNVSPRPLGLSDISFRLWSSEQPFGSHNHSPHTHSAAGAVSGDGSPEFPGSHVHGATKSARAAGVAGVGRSSSEEVMRTHYNFNDDLSVHSNSLSTIPENNQNLSLFSEPATVKKKVKKGRVIASRYMSAAKKPPSSGSVFSSSLTPATVTGKSGTSSRGGQSALKLKSEQRAGSSSTKQSTHLFRHLQTPQSFPSAHQPSSAPTSLPFTPSSMITSTPTHVYETTLNSSVGSTTTTDTKKASKALSDVSELQTELFLTRLLQASYMDVMSARSLRLQEEEAKSQVNQIWECVEEKKNRIMLLKKIIETEERTIALEKAIEIQLQSLGPVNSKLKQLEQHYSAMAKALDATCHEMALSGILPCSEGETQAELSLSEQLMGDIIAIIREKVPMVSGLSNSTEALVSTLEKQYGELQMCWEELSVLVRVQVHNTSLLFEQRQRNLVADGGHAI